MASNVIAGTCFFKADGQQYMLGGNWKVAPNAVMYKGAAGASGLRGAIATYQVPWMEGEISDMGSLSVQALQNLTNNTFTLELVNGKTYVINNGWYASAGELDVMNGTTVARFEGNVTELTAS